MMKIVQFSTLFMLQVTMAGQQGMQFVMRPGMPPGSQGQPMYAQQPGQQFQRMQGIQSLHLN